MESVLKLAQAIATHAHVQPGKVAVRDSHRSCTYRDIDERATKLANVLLGLGLEPGDRVAVLAYNRAEWLEIFTAMGWCGLVVVPINFRLASPEMRYLIEDAGA